MLTVTPRRRSGIFGESTNDEAYKVLPGEDRLVKDVMTHDLATMEASARIKDAIEVIRRRNVPILVVCLDDEPVLAMTEYDLAMSLVREGFSETSTLSGFTTKRKSLRCREEAILGDAIQAMLDSRIRHAPVVNVEGELVGALSLVSAIGAITPDAATHWLTEMRRVTAEVEELR